MYLKDYAGDDQDQHRKVIIVLLTHRQDVLELGGVTGEEGNVQHALGDGLLGGVPVGVQLGLEERQD